MPRRVRSAETPEQILAVAAEIIRRDGMQKLTIDAVAAEVGISKGGVLHHFGTKDALIVGVVHHVAAQMGAGIDAQLAGLTQAGGTYLQAMLHQARALFVNDEAFPRALLIAASENAEANSFVNGFILDLLARAKATTPSGLAEVVFFALLGIQFSRAFGIARVNKQQAASLFTTLEDLAADNVGR